MREYTQFYIDGRWVDPAEPKTLDVDNPATEMVCGKIALGSAADVDLAVAAARRAFTSWSQSSRAERLDLLQAILAEYQRRSGDLADAVSEEMGRRPAWPPGSRSISGLVTSSRPSTRSRTSRSASSAATPWWSASRSGYAVSSRRGTGR